ncbi:MAG TPA: FAD-dependent oxidoreductase [Pelomicrobium sp.]|nr:FAD-dependent oxidoreductase [Pelomicrobium sp.]
MSEPRPRVLLVGAGHAHLHVARNARRFAERGIELTLVDPGRLWYSGMATGMLGGLYAPEEDQIDPCPVIESQGGRFVLDRVVGIDRGARRVELASGTSIGYDVVSFNIGSRIAADPAWLGLERVWTVKPIPELAMARSRVESLLAANAGDALRAVVVGGGATGCEVAANLDGLARRHGRRAAVTVVDGAYRLLAGYPAGAARTLRRRFRRRGIETVLGDPAVVVRQGEAQLESGRRLPWDVLVVAIGLKPAALAARLGLPVNDEGALRVSAALTSVADDRVFAVGDCAALEGHRLPKLGVFGVRQAPVLLENLLARAAGAPLAHYRPQRVYLSILNLGDGSALAAWGPFYWTAPWCMRWKEKLDRRFVERYQRFDTTRSRGR